MKHCALRACLLALLVVAVSGCAKHIEPPALDPTRLPPSGSARQALLVAEVAAATWMDDAELLYVENDGRMTPGGSAPAWGFLFHSAGARAWRNIAVEAGRVTVEEALEFPFAAPQLPREWIDSDLALSIAESAGGADFRQTARAEIGHAVLSRGVFHDPTGEATWTFIYRSPTRGELAIVLNAADGSVLAHYEG